MEIAPAQRHRLGAPLGEDGTINSTEGYDTATGMWCENVPDLSDLVPAKPSLGETAAALRLIRETFKTFCFADAETIGPAPGGVATVDKTKAPGRDESSFLAALLTAVCRPSFLHCSWCVPVARAAFRCWVPEPAKDCWPMYQYCCLRTGAACSDGRCKRRGTGEAHLAAEKLM